MSRVGVVREHRRVLDWRIGFIDTLYTPFGTTDNYSAIADLRTLQFTVTHALGFSVFTSRILATDFITVSLSLKITHEVFFAPPNSFLAIILQLPTQFNSSAAKLISRQAGVSKHNYLFADRPQLDSSS
jgi:hypothetical protein